MASVDHSELTVVKRYVASYALCGILVTVESAWWLLIVWHMFDIRTYATSRWLKLVCIFHECPVVMKNFIFTQGPISNIVIACICLCVSVCLCVNPKLVCALIHHLFNLGTLNLYQRCKTHWLRSLLFWGVINLVFLCEILLEIKILLCLVSSPE